MTLEIDSAAEDAVFAALEATGAPLTAVSEERGELTFGGGGGARVVIDPIDGSLNAKRRIPPSALSIAVADGETMADVSFGYVAELVDEREWWAARGGGAWENGKTLHIPAHPEGIEVLGLESVSTQVVADTAERLRALDVHRLRVIGAIALSLTSVASGRFDAMASLWPCRSVDAAAAQLIVREAGGSVAFPDVADGGLGATLGLDMRSRVWAARDAEALAALGEALG